LTSFFFVTADITFKILKINKNIILGIAIAVVEDGMVVVYHCMDNSRFFKLL
jgi:hypothetical protein